MKTIYTDNSKRTSLLRWSVLLGLLVVGATVTSIAVANAQAENDDQSTPRAHDDGDHEAEMEEAIDDMVMFMAETELLSEHIDFIRRFETLAATPEAAGVAAVLAVEDHVDGPADAAAFYEEMLPQTEKATVRRALRLKLVDAYHEMGQHDKALAQLHLLIAPSNEASK